jgi:hypothetical protein
MLRLVTLIALVVGTLVPAAGATGAPSAENPDDHAGVGIRLVDAPVAARNDPRARVYIIDHLAPGTRIERRIELSNDAPTDADVKIYAAAAETSQGRFLGLDGETQNDLSSWTSVNRNTLDLASDTRQLVAVTIHVPKDAAPGEKYAVIWAQTTTSAADNGTGVTQVSRVGIRVYLSIGPGGEPASKFKIETLTAARDAAGIPLVRATIKNTGGRALDLTGTLKLSDGPGGLSAGPFPVVLGTTLGIGEAAPVTIVMDKELPNGPWNADIKVTSGLLTKTGHANITFPDAGTGPTVAVEEPASRWWTVPSIVLGLGLLLALLYLARRYRLRATRARLRHVLA